MASNHRVRPLPKRFSSPWSLGYRFRLLAWELCWTTLCRGTPKPLNGWRLLVLRLFGAEIRGRPFVHQRARIEHPWNLTLMDRACLGDRAHVYAIDLVVVAERAIVAQEAYLCTASHDFEDGSLPLLTAPIQISADAFLGARCFVLPGITIGSRSIVGACSVVTRDVPDGVVVGGNPARPLNRSVQHQTSST